ncbi:MAG: energy-coupling factor transporter transmembrane protein EcfT [Dermatophilus congolensis]|nr:energy-coupling factor transporter transmembrane protein EcfT [Dermatophilus congolensis]
MLTGLYVPGDSVFHRARPGIKLLILLVLTTALLVFASPATVLAGALAVVAGALIAGLGWKWLWQQIYGLRWIIVLLTVVQVWVNGAVTATNVVGSLVVAITGAGLVTATTLTSDMMDSIIAATEPLRRFGVDPERVGLLFSLAIRGIPVIADIVREVTEARRARGLGNNLRALLVPVVVRTIRHAERVGEALVARGADD